jgi:hypothetical protein
VGVVSPTFSLSNTKLLFHTLYTPTVNGTPTVIAPGETLYANADQATAIAGNGKLFMKVLAPANHNLRVVGGHGQKSFWVFGQNYDYHWASTEPQPRPTTEYDPLPYGEWRIELEPADAGLDHNFLTVLYPTISATVNMPAATLINGTGLAGAHLADPALNRLALFSSALDGSAPLGTLAYSYQPTATTLNVLLDLTPNARYDLTTTIAANTQVITLTLNANGAYHVSAQGVLSFYLSADGVVPIPPTYVYLPVIMK